MCVNSQAGISAEKSKKIDNAELDMDWIHPWIGLDWIVFD